MTEALNHSNKFIEQAESMIVQNLSNEQFGVSELAEAMNMSRSNLLRKVKKETKLSASQFIRQVRLQQSMKLLTQTSLTVSEVSYKVGFGSTSYFIKCFREYYGHPPGEVGKREEEAEVQESDNKFGKFRWPVLAVAGLVLIAVFFWFFGERTSSSKDHQLVKSLAILPFKNESSDSTNLYFVNGLMESTLSNLQKIEDLRVISRTSVEKYRETDKGIPEIAAELNVNYLVEGSGQKVGDKVLLNIQLIEAASDQPIWSEQYSREAVDIFTLQNEVAREIAIAIKAIVTPAELEQIQKKPTEDLIAYDYYLKSLDPFYSRTHDGLWEAIALLEKAIEQDPQFALAYANLSMAYYFLDLFQVEKQYTELINNYADKALLYDSKLAESLIAKALYYLHINDYRLALPHLEKALEYNPNSSGVVQMLSTVYSQYLPNTAKYLEYALKGVQLDIAANDSTTLSYIYLQLSNAFIQTGFIDEAAKYIEMSIEQDPNNYYSPYLKAFILYARDLDLDKTKKILIREWKKDTTRLDIMQEVAKVYYIQEDYDSAFYYYQMFVNGENQRGIDIYPHEDAKIAWVYEKLGHNEKAQALWDAYADYCNRDESIYNGASRAILYTHEGKLDEAIEQLRIFSTQDGYMYWILLFTEMDPMMEPLKQHPEFDEIMQTIKDRFWENQAKLRKSLEEKGLL